MTEPRRSEPSWIAGIAMGFALIVLGAGIKADRLLAAQTGPAAAPTHGHVDLRTVASFDGIADRSARSAALFAEAGKVMQLPRCLNCHPAGDRPSQTNAMQPHQPLVVRGADGKGPAGGSRCDTCHQAKNFQASGVPGNPKWSLAPARMAWQGKSLGEICALLKDADRNGGRGLDAIVAHVSDDDLVGWAWHPGGQRSPAPGTQLAFGRLMAAWAATGAVCPTR